MSFLLNVYLNRS